MLRENNELDHDQPPTTDGLVVEETRDADTLRQFVRAWRRRVNHELAHSLLEDRPHDRHEAWFR
ncbi:MAG TPA: hypothetical protein PL152_07940 [Steroidobacteraceae bacterium]|nr:hypothetical protein [Steroidobacteraceae bacterium]HQR49252.1 hypothetical protein [Steroidobacteraceae bacterium]